MGQFDVPRLILQNERACPLEHARGAARKPSGVAAGKDLLASRLDADEPHAGVFDESVEDAHRVAASADARDDHVGKSSNLVEHLDTGFLTDDGLELPHHE